MRRRTWRKIGFTLIEVLVAIAIIGVLIALLLPAIQAAREAARRMSCANNLHQFGIALQNYATTTRAFPPGAQATISATGADIFANANTLLLPYLEESAVASRYQYKRPYWEQLPAVVQLPVAVFTCPSNGFQLFQSDIFAQLGLPVGESFATTDYAFCRGSTDSWCITLEYPADEKGVFQIGRTTKLRQITDGLSQTIAMGEAAGGDHWPLCQRPGCTEPHDPSHDASTPWVIGNLATADMAPQFISSSVYGSTAEPLNKRPATSTFLDPAGALDCRSSRHGGPHAVSNFRSDHPGGGQFLSCDGSVHFLLENIEFKVYQRLSTIAEGTQAAW